MCETAGLDIAQSFLADARPAVRVHAPGLLVEINDPQVEYLLAETVHDPDPTVAASALGVLLQRNPWLALQPFFVRDLPSIPQASPEGQHWMALCAGFRDALERRVPEPELLRRWLKLPGFIPELVAVLEGAGHATLAATLARDGDLYGCAPASQRQVLLAPTYLCNLDCSYCYAKEWTQRAPTNLSLDGLDVLFDWLQRTGLNHLNLCGGEPTVYRYLAELLERAKRNGVRISITTNGLYTGRIRALLRRYPVLEVVGHYDQETMQAAPQRTSEFTENLRDAQNAGSNVFLRYTLTAASTKEEWQPLLRIAEQLNLSSIHYGIAFGNMEGTNNYYEYRFGEENRDFEHDFLTFAEACWERGLTLHQCKPVPLCVFSPETLSRLLLNGTLRASCAAYLGDCTRNLTINPDLTTFPCNAIGVKGPKITELNGLSDASRHFRPLITDLLQRPFSTACENCFHFYRGFCQGVCMAQHYATGSDGP